MTTELLRRSTIRDQHGYSAHAVAARHLLGSCRYTPASAGLARIVAVIHPAGRPRAHCPNAARKAVKLALAGVGS